MTPSARFQAAIEVLDRVLQGMPTEQALTAWARGARYAGSKDRAAVRDHVFDAVRCRRSCAALGGVPGGRGLILGALRAAGTDPAAVFTGAPYAPAPLTEAETRAGRRPDGAERLDLPDWLWSEFRESLGAGAEAAALALRHRAGVHLRVNLARIARGDAAAALEGEGIATRPHPATETALIVTDGARRLRGSGAYAAGLVELQDAASQALALDLPLEPGHRVLDYCAGGGGKSLAMAARMPLNLFAHDAVPARMRDLRGRADRAGVTIRVTAAPDLPAVGPFDLVLCDVPCSGSGSWRRDPDGKWRLTPADLDALGRTQASILDNAAALVRPGGILAYATCSVLSRENAGCIGTFLQARPGFRSLRDRQWPIDAGTDGFYLALLTRA